MSRATPEADRLMIWAVTDTPSPRLTSTAVRLGTMRRLMRTVSGTRACCWLSSIRRLAIEPGVGLWLVTRTAKSHAPRLNDHGLQLTDISNAAGQLVIDARNDNRSELDPSRRDIYGNRVEFEAIARLAQSWQNDRVSRGRPAFVHSLSIQYQY